MKIIIGSLFIICSGLPVISLAQVVNCDGRWTNKPCETNVDATLTEVKKKLQESAEDLDLRRKNSRLQELSLKNSKARRIYGVEVDVQLVREKCQYEGTTYEQCAELIGQTEERLLGLIQQEKIVRAEEEKARTSQQDQTPPVVIVNPDNSGSYESLYDYCSSAPDAYRCRNFVRPGQQNPDERISVNVDASSVKGDTTVNVNVNDRTRDRESPKRQIKKRGPAGSGIRAVGEGIVRDPR